MNWFKALRRFAPQTSRLASTPCANDWGLMVHELRECQQLDICILNQPANMLGSAIGRPKKTKPPILSQACWHESWMSPRHDRCCEAKYAGVHPFHSQRVLIATFDILLSTTDDRLAGLRAITCVGPDRAQHLLNTLAPYHRFAEQ